MDKYTNNKLTKREVSILKELTTGKNNKEIAKDLSVSSHTIKFYVSSIFSKLSVTSRVEAAVKAVKENLI